MALAAPTSALLRAQLLHIKIGVAALIATLGMLLIAYEVYDYRSQIALARTEASEIADMAALNAQAVLRLAQQVLIGIGEVNKYTPGAATPHSALVRKTLQGWKNRTAHLMDLLVVEPPGRIVHWTGPGLPPDVSDREYISYHLTHADSGLYVGSPQLSKVHAGKWFFGISEAQRDGAGEVQRVLVAIIDLNAFRDAMGVSFSMPGSSLALASGAGVVYTRSPDHALYVGKQVPPAPAMRELARRSDSGTVALQSPLDGQARMLAFRRLPEHNLYAIGTVSLIQVLRPWRERLWLLGALWLVCSAVTLWFGRRMAAAARAYELLANTDSLTGVLNRRSLLDLAGGVERRSGEQRDVTVLMIDVDHFKNINDTLGHAAGDAVLRQLGALLRANCRGGDLVGRYGGEEFLVILDNSSASGALQLAEKLRQKVSTIQTELGAISISIGVACTDALEGSLDAAIRRADHAMYAAKQAGRNRVVLAQI